jgi:hypothetical protein
MYSFRLCAHTVGKLEIRRISCVRPLWRVRVDRLIERYGLDEKINKWSGNVTGIVNHLSDQCRPIRLYLQKVV